MTAAGPSSRTAAARTAGCSGPCGRACRKRAAARGAALQARCGGRAEAWRALWPPQRSRRPAAHPAMCRMRRVEEREERPAPGGGLEASPACSASAAARRAEISGRPCPGCARSPCSAPQPQSWGS
eukprot:3082365-Prymnesium_polylepis.1